VITCSLAAAISRILADVERERALPHVAALIGTYV
jgi:hypothetical protein